MNSCDYEYDIVSLRAKQAGEVAALEEACFSHPTSEAGILHELTVPEGIYLAALSREEQKVLGYVGMYAVLDEGYINNLAVHPDARRQGIGRRLMETLLEKGQRAGLAFITLEVRPSNEAALGLYSSLGFEKVGERKNYYEDPVENALLLTRFFSKGE